MGDLLAQELFEIGNFLVDVHTLILTLILLTILIGLWILSTRWFDQYQKDHSIPDHYVRRIFYYKSLMFLFVFVQGLLLLFELRFNLFTLGDYEVRLTAVLFLLEFVLAARIFDMIISSRIVEEMSPRDSSSFHKAQSSPTKSTRSITRNLDYFILGVIAVIGLRTFNVDLSINLFKIKGNDVNIHISNIISLVLVILAARIILWTLVNFVLHNVYKRNSIDVGKQYSYNTLLGYVVYFLAAIVALQSLGINMTLIWGGAAALLVGVGLALQQTISDFFSGIVLLFERTIEVGDFVVVGSVSGTIKKIGIRASIIETLERKETVIPNSKLVTDTIINWNTTRQIARFDIKVGVAYGSDLELVRILLLQSLDNHPYVVNNPKPFVRFVNFGDSALEFALYFFSGHYIQIEDVKSEIRFKIDKLFKENKVQIPFPQRDIWIRSSQQ